MVGTARAEQDLTHPAADLPPPPRKPSAFAPIALGLALLLLVGVAIRRVLQRGDESSQAANSPTSLRGKVLADGGPLPDFSLIDRFSNPFTLADLQGHICVVNFFFTSCPGPCVDLTRKVRTLAMTLRAEPEVHFVSVSVDPAADTPTQLTRFAGAQGGELDRWHWLTGDLEQVKALSAACFAALGERSPEGTIPHSTRVHVIDRAGRLRAVHDTESDPDWLEATVHSVRLLLEQQPAAPAKSQ